jgi:hypothetical protein
MKQNYTLFTYLIMCSMLSFSIVPAESGLTMQERLNLQEIAKDSAQDIFHTAQTTIDQTVRYTTIMQMLRELNDKAQASEDKNLIRNAEKNVEEQYRTLLTQNARATAAPTQGSLVYLNDREREALNTLIASNIETILREPAAESEAASRRDLLLKKLQEFITGNLSPEDQQLIEKARQKILDAFTEWKRTQQQSAEQQPAEKASPTEQSTTVEMPPMEEGPAAPPLEGPSIVSEEGIPEAPPLEPETTKSSQAPQVTRPAQSGQKPQQPQSGRDELLRSIRERGGRKLRPVQERPAPSSKTSAGNVRLSPSEALQKSLQEKLRERRKQLDEEEWDTE